MPPLSLSRLSSDVIKLVADHVFHSLCDDRVLPYVAAAGNAAFPHVPKHMHIDSVGLAVYRSTDRRSDERGGNIDDEYK